ncbi:MAG: sugar ABC transporter permease [Xylanivirga thermophila]|jgi:multiple sugar transport system permease protein|uniref:carbohydrate ABC transporter permease n=1 Tax=Xylanivirga thermophila TaxID=2496273 RepID=UPI00101DFB43|nr:sugar ABC transporter permease [Xylanivirga thermophila]
MQNVQKQKRDMLDSDSFVGWLFSAPFLILWISWFLYPFIQSFSLSFQSFDFLNPDNAKFVGLENYKNLFQNNPEFYKALWHSVQIVLIAVPVQTIIALLLAGALNKDIKGQGFFRTVYVMPNITSGIAAATVFMILFRQDHLITRVLSTVFKLPNETWTANVNLALPFVIILYIWQQVGFFMIIYLAGLQDIPKELYEASTVDGANGWQRFHNITVPMLRPVTFFVVTVGTINAFQIFDQVAAISRYGVLGSPAGATSTLLTYFYQHGIRYTEDMGLGSASVIVFFLIILAITLLQKKLLDEKEEV